jgi:elongation factor 1-beta
VTFKAFSAAPDAEKYPHVARWYKHIASYESEFTTLPGDASKAFTAYGPEGADLPANPKDKPEEDEEEDLFGSDSEEEDAAVVEERNRRLEDYKAKKAAKGPKPAAKSIVTLEVKPWGMFFLLYRSQLLISTSRILTYFSQMTRPILPRWRPTSVPSRWTV